MAVHVLDPRTAPAFIRSHPWSETAASIPSAILFRSQKPVSQSKPVFRKGQWNPKNVFVRENLMTPLLNVPGTSSAGSKPASRTMGQSGSTVSDSSPTNRSQPDRAQKRMRAGQTYYPPTVEDDPLEQGDAGRPYSDTNEPSPKRQKGSTGAATTPDTSRSRGRDGQASQSSRSRSAAPSRNQSPVTTTSTGFTPINAPRQPAQTVQSSPPSTNTIDENDVAYNATCKLHALFLSGEKLNVSQSALKTASEMLTKVEDEILIPDNIPKNCSLERTLQSILALEKIPGEARFDFRTRIERLLRLWTGWKTQPIVPAPTANMSGTSNDTSSGQPVVRQDDMLARPAQDQTSPDAAAPPAKEKSSKASTQRKDKGKAPVRPSEGLSTNQLQAAQHGFEDFVHVDQLLSEEGVGTSSNTGSKAPNSKDVSTKAKPKPKSTTKTSKDTLTPKSILKSPTKPPTKLSSSKSAPVTPQRHVITAIDLTGRRSREGSEDSAGRGASGDSATTAPKPLGAFDLASMFEKERAELKRKKQELDADVERQKQALDTDKHRRRQELDSNEELMDDIQTRWDVVLIEKDIVRKEQEALRQKMDDLDKQEAQIHKRWQEIKGRQ